MKEIMSTKNGFVVVENDKVVEEFDREELLLRLLAEQKEKAYEDFQRWENRLNGLGWAYNAKHEDF